MVCSGRGGKTSWESGPVVTTSDISNGEGVVAGLGTLLATKKGGVGVIFHSADCSVLNYVNEAFDNLDKMSAVMTLSIENPSSVILGDVQSVAEGHRWRPVAVPGATKGRFALFRLSSRDLGAATKLDQLDGNFSVAVRSAHMEALAVGQGLAGLLDADNAPSGQFGRILVYYYRRSTMIAVYSDAGVLSELRLLPQSEGGCPQTLRNDFSLMLQKAPSPEVLVTVFQCAEGVETLVEELGAVKSVTGVNVSLQVLERSVFPEFCQSAGLPLRLTGDFLPLEMAIEYPEWLVGHGIGGKVEESTAIALASADFLASSSEARQSVPTPSDLKIFLLGKFLRAVLFLSTIGLLAWWAWEGWQKYRSDEWAVDMEEVGATSGEVAGLQGQKQTFEEFKKITQPKPEGAFAMEIALGLFPSGGEVLVETIAISVKDRAAAGFGESGAGKKEISIEFGGMATQRGIALLNRLRNQQYLDSVVRTASDTFKLGAGSTGTPVFSFSERRRESGGSSGEGDKYTVSFSGQFVLPFEVLSLGGGEVMGASGEVIVQ